MVIASLLQQAAFDAETVQVLTTAFDQAWEKVEASSGPLADPSAADANRLLLARHIIELGRRGERNINRLVDGALARLADSM